MKQFLLKIECPAKSGTFVLTRREYNYLINVRRMQQGDEISALDKNGKSLKLTIDTLDTQKGECICKWEEAEVQHHDENITKKVMIFSLLKGKKNDTVIRQAVETGVTEIIPVISEHTVARPEEQSGIKKIERWNKIIKEAVQQCGRHDIPKLHNITTLVSAAQNKKEQETALFFHQERDDKTTEYDIIKSTRTLFAIGPEGGFSNNEVTMLKAAGFLPVHIETPVMRAETAAVAASIMITTIASEK